MVTSLLPLCAYGVNIISSNDDGWAEINIRELYDSLTSAGHSVVISAPAENQSGKGSLDATPTALRDPCEFNSCPAGSPPYGFNASEPRFNYVNSFPLTSMKHGIDSLAPRFFGDSPVDLAVSGPNVGANLGAAVFFSGTAGAATYAANEGEIPAIAFSGASGSQTAWNVTPPAYSPIYAELATNLTNRLLASDQPYLPKDVWLNVNFPEVSDSSCNNVQDFEFVLSRIFPAVPLVTPDDVETCGSKRLPIDIQVMATKGCYVSVSVGVASTKLDASADAQNVVLEKLGGLLTCLP